MQLIALEHLLLLDKNILNISTLKSPLISLPLTILKVSFEKKENFMTTCGLNHALFFKSVKIQSYGIKESNYQLDFKKHNNPL